MENTEIVQFKENEELKKLIDIEVSKALNRYYSKVNYIPYKEYNLSPAYNINNRVEINSPNGFKISAPSDTFIQAIGLIGMFGILGFILHKKL